VPLVPLVEGAMLEEIGNVGRWELLDDDPSRDNRMRDALIDKRSR